MEQARERTSWARLAIGLAIVALAVLYLKHGALAAEAVRRGLTLCAKTMIPSLFPFMVIAELAVQSGVGQMLARPFVRLFGRVLGVSESGGCALVLGMLCGFPVGAKVAASCYKDGAMDVWEFNHVLGMCSVPSAAFLVGAVGKGLLGSAPIGKALLGLTIFSALAVGLLLRLVPWARSSNVARRSGGAPAHNKPDASLLSSSISSAANGMLGVCATVVVFSALMGVLEVYAEALGLSGTARAALCGLLELSTGTARAATLKMTEASVLCAAMAGWAGLSVHCQMLSACDGCPVLLGRFWISRALQAVLCGGGMWLLLRMGYVKAPSVPSISPVGPVASESVWLHVWQSICMIGFWAAIALLWMKRGKGGGEREAKKTAVAENER